MEKRQCISSCNCVDNTISPIISIYFSSFESSIKAFDNIFGNEVFLMNTVLLTCLFVCIQTGSVRKGWKFSVTKWT